MINTTQQEFLKLTKKGNLIPIYKEVLGDLETPVSAYFKVIDKAQYSFLLESVEGQEKMARFSFLAKDPEYIFETRGNKATITRFNKGKATKEVIKDAVSPLAIVRDLMAHYKFVKTPGIPQFCGGLVGYLSYDTVRFFEKIPHTTTDDLKLPEAILMMAKSFIIFDHLHHKIKIVHCIELDKKDSVAIKIKKYKAAIKQVNTLERELQRPLDPKKLKPKKNITFAQAPLKSNFTKSEFKKAVETAKKYIRAGEIIQVVLSQRFNVELKTDPIHIYRALRALNPSPYMYILNFKGLRIVGSSPELLVRCEEGIVETRPIAGTRPRGKDEAEDEALAKDLLDDPKEKAEHIMLVDLGRNDIGRVCEKGSVHLNEFMKIEKYSHVMHIVSNVKGKLIKGKDAFDVLAATFPAGTVSGAPKIRAMEIIDELEALTRGPYAGCIGYFSFSGNLDTCITIRTIIIKNNKAYIQAGAGIVADSVPEKEYQETANKAKSQLLAIEYASQANNRKRSKT